MTRLSSTTTQGRAPSFAPVDGVAMPCLSMNHGSGGGRGVSDMLTLFLKSLPRAPTGVVVVEAHAFGAAGQNIAVTGEQNLCMAVANLVPGAQKGPVSGHGLSDCKHAFRGIPIVALSLRNTEDASVHLALGANLAPLRKKGVVIIGSGVPSIHNFDVLFRNRTNQGHNVQKAHAFDTWLTSAVSVKQKNKRFELLKRWEQAPGARVCHSAGAAEHFFPTLVVAGAASDHGGIPCFPKSHSAIIGLPAEALIFPARHFVFGASSTSLQHTE